MSNTNDLEYLAKAVDLAHHGLQTGAGGPFGALIVVDDAIVASGHNCVLGMNDPTAHAEIVTIRAACTALDTFRLDGATLYSSCEPCPMCLAATYWSRVDRIVYAATRADAARAGFDDARFYEEFALPESARSLATERIVPPQSGSEFDAWLALTMRTDY